MGSDLKFDHKLNKKNVKTIKCRTKKTKKKVIFLWKKKFNELCS